MEIWRFIGAFLLLSIIQSVFSDSDPFDYLQNNQFDDYEHAPGEPLSPLDFQNGDKLNTMSPPSNNDNNSDPIEIAGLYEGDIIIPSSIKGVPQTEKNAIKNDGLWKNGFVPYLISSQFDERERSVIARAISEFHRRTCIVFKPRSEERDYIHIVKGQGCSSPVGRIGGGAQQVTLGVGCVSPGIAIHELMHAVGFWHEQSRWDRDDFVTVYFENIKPGMDFNFQKYSWKDIQNLSAVYDTGSIMHYGPYAFSKDKNMPTILPKNPNDKIGQRQNFSQVDLFKINTLYKCGNHDQDSVSTSPPPECTDNHRHCRKWSEAEECSRNPSWMLINCKKSCNQCDTPCSDANNHCKAWSKSGECSKNPGYMHTHCSKSCKKCETDSIESPSGNNSHSSPLCEDKDISCPSWAARGQCDKNPKYMKNSCAKSCNSCHHQ